MSFDTIRMRTYSASKYDNGWEVCLKAIHGLVTSLATANHWSIQRGSVFVFSRFCSRQPCQQVSDNKCLCFLIPLLLSRPCALNHFNLSIHYSRHPFIYTTRNTFSHLWTSVKCRAMVSESPVKVFTHRRWQLPPLSLHYGTLQRIHLFKTSVPGRIVTLPKISGYQYKENVMILFGTYTVHIYTLWVKLVKIFFFFFERSVVCKTKHKNSNIVKYF